MRMNHCRQKPSCDQGNTLQEHQGSKNVASILHKSARTVEPYKIKYALHTNCMFYLLWNCHRSMPDSRCKKNMFWNRSMQNRHVLRNMFPLATCLPFSIPCVRPWWLAVSARDTSIIELARAWRDAIVGELGTGIDRDRTALVGSQYVAVSVNVICDLAT